MATTLTATPEELTGRGVDDFGELAVLKRDVEARSATLGHLITSWAQRGSHDPYGREAFCERCGAVAVVTTEPTLGRPRSYGWTLTRRCAPGALRYVALAEREAA
jgi:hypothetical protein